MNDEINNKIKRLIGTSILMLIGTIIALILTRIMLLFDLFIDNLGTIVMILLFFYIYKNVEVNEK